MTFENWKQKNLQWKSWYLENYPFLQDFDFPVPVETLKEFYRGNQIYLGLPENPVYYEPESYEILFSYFLYHYPLEDEKPVRNFFELTIENLPKAISKTFTDIKETTKDVFTNPFVLLGIAAVLVFLFKK